MSIEALNWAFNLRMESPADKAVLIGLCNHVAPDGRCWPGVQRLTLYTALDERTVRRALRRLEEQGLLVTTSRPLRSNLYTLPAVAALHGQADHEQPPGVGAESPHPGGSVPPPGGAAPPEPSMNHQMNPSPKRRRAPKDEGLPLSAEWWPPVSEFDWAAEKFPILKGVLDHETTKFVANAEERGRTFHRPVAAWRRWIANAAIFAARDNVRPAGGGRASPAARSEENARRIDAALGDLFGGEDVVDAA